jgi:hypothetical protein
VTNVDRRLAKVEEALDPAGIIVRWLAEAHACGDMSAYVRARPDDPMPPLDALVRQAKQAATGRARGRPRDEADATLRNAVVGTVFRFKLVLRMNVVTSDLPDREVLIHAALAMAGVMAMEGLSERRGLMLLATCRDRLLARVTELLCHDAARANVEKKYLRGMPTLFPATQRQSDDQVRQSQTMAVMTMRLAELDGFGGRSPDDPKAVERRVAALVADLTEPARSDAYNEIGDGRRAYAVGRRWVHASATTRAVTASNA